MNAVIAAAQEGDLTATPLASPPLPIRHYVRAALNEAPGYALLDADDRVGIAQALVRIAHAAKLLEAESAPPVRATGPARAMNAADEFSGAAVDRMAASTQRVLHAISFPRFVGELINGVFRAMLETNQQQLRQYVELVRGVSQSLDGFAAIGGSDDAARRWLAEQFPQSFAIEGPDPDDRPDPNDEPEPLRLISIGSPPSAEAIRAALGLEPGEQVPSGGGEALVPFVRRMQARNRQQILATMIQLGMQRIVIDSGRINASMRFHIDARSAAAEDRSSKFDTRTTIGARGHYFAGLWGVSASVNTTIGYVSTTDTSTREELNAAADLNSSVELHFRTDQVPLDRIASQQTVDRLRLNTLNPERELDIARQADQARMEHSRAIETARAAQPRPAAALPAATAPAAGATAPGAGSSAAQPRPAATPPAGTQPAGTPTPSPSASPADPRSTTPPSATTPAAPATTPAAPATRPPSGESTAQPRPNPTPAAAAPRPAAAAPPPPRSG